MKNKSMSKYYYCKGCNNIIYRESSTKFSYCVNKDKKIQMTEVKDFLVIQIFKQLRKVSNE